MSNQVEENVVSAPVVASLADPQSKILNLDTLAREVQLLKATGKRVVLAHGVFDLIHPGHVRHLQAARKLGDYLVVTLSPDHFVNKGPGRPFFPQHIRCESIAALACVDFVAVNEWPTAVETIRTVCPDIYVKGSEYENAAKDVTGKILDEAEAIREVGGELRYTDDLTFSSTELLNNFFGVYSDAATQFLRGLRSRTSHQDVLDAMENLSKLKVLLVGDTIIDEYHYVNPKAKSPKENVIVTQYVSEERFAGGVIAAANHVASLCGQVDVVTCLGGQTSYEGFVRDHLKENVRLKAFYRPGEGTIVKRRFVEQAYMRKLFEVCFLDDSPLAAEIEQQVCEHLEATLQEYDLVIVTDFGHGFVGSDMVDTLCKHSRFLAVNAQTNSANMGYNLVTKYPRADYVCIDAPEARLAAQNRTGELIDVVETLRARIDCTNFVITHGNHGCLTYDETQGYSRIPAFTTRAIDTVGAGDAFLALSSPCVAAGMPMEWAGVIGNTAGAMKVGIVGHRNSIEKAPLLKAVTALLR